MNEISLSDLSHFVKYSYNKTVQSLKRLDGYDDQNYEVTVKNNYSNEMEFGYTEETFVLKLSGETISYIEWQLDIMRHLHKHSVSTSLPVVDVNNKFMNVVTFHVTKSSTEVPDSKTFVAYLLTFIPEVTMFEMGNPFAVIEDVGRLVGRIGKALMTFETSTIHLHKAENDWEMSRLPEVEAKARKYCSKDETRLAIDVINDYREQIEPFLDQFQKSVIHGDINNCNIILKKNQNGAYVVSGIIDFGDACHSYSVSEIVIVMADLMSACLEKQDPLDVARKLLRGYLNEFKLNTQETD